MVLCACRCLLQKSLRLHNTPRDASSLGVHVGKVGLSCCMFLVGGLQVPLHGPDVAPRQPASPLLVHDSQVILRRRMALVCSAAIFIREMKSIIAFTNRRIDILGAANISMP
jgi:hypothetical protein